MSAPDRPNRVPEIKAALTDPTRVLDALGLLGEGRQRRRQSAGWLVRCPVHQENTPSCSVQAKSEGIVWKCHGCGATGDVLTLIAVARGLNTGRDFPRVLAEAARLGGLWHIAAELEGRGPVAPEPARPATTLPQDASERPLTYPDGVQTVWEASRGLPDDADVCAYMLTRALDPDRIAAADLARTLPASGTLPRWTRCRLSVDEDRYGTWREAGYRVLVPMFDPAGVLTSVRAWRTVQDDSGLPKRLPPSGHKASGLVMADAFALAWLRGTRTPEQIVVVEGEPDFLSRCLVTNDPHSCVIGIVSGSWTAEFAAKVPLGSRVVIRTDNNPAGDRYAAEIAESVKRKAFIWRTEGV
jgi:hypothetical protein